MPRTRVTEEVLYKFEELSDEAKEKAREWFRDGYPDHEWWDCTYDDAKTVAGFMGFEVKDIGFSGFWSQGDGAHFTGSWSASQVDVDKLREYAPQDTELHRIAEGLAEIAKKYPEASMSIAHSGHYQHENCTRFDFEFGVDEAIPYGTPEYKAAEKVIAEDQDTAEELARDLMRWIYRQLEDEYNWLVSDEQVDETIIANEYEFTEDGKIA